MRRQRKERNKKGLKLVVRSAEPLLLTLFPLNPSIQQRRMLREQALQNAALVEQAYGAIFGAFNFLFSSALHTDWLAGDPEDEEEWTGIRNSTQNDQARDEEYEDEEVLATVTVVEDFDPDSIIHGPPKTEAPTSSFLLRSEPKSSQPPPQSKPLERATNRKKPREKIRYETKNARKREQTKQRARRTEKAELAGGKAARKSTHGGRRKNGSRR